MNQWNCFKRGQITLNEELDFFCICWNNCCGSRAVRLWQMTWCWTISICSADPRIRKVSFQPNFYSRCLFIKLKILKHVQLLVLDSRFKMALLLPIKHRIIYITVIATWNVNTSTNTAMHYHGSKGNWKSCGIYGLLVCYTYSKYISTGVQRVQEKKNNTKWHYQ